MRVRFQIESLHDAKWWLDNLGDIEPLTVYANNHEMYYISKYKGEISICQKTGNLRDPWKPMWEIASNVRNYDLTPEQAIYNIRKYINPYLCFSVEV